MRFMIMVRAGKDMEAGVMSEETLFASMAKYHEELVKVFWNSVTRFCKAQ